MINRDLLTHIWMLLVRSLLLGEPLECRALFGGLQTDLVKYLSKSDLSREGTSIHQA